MIAILGALLEENDIDGRLIPPQFTIPGEFTDMEINRIGVFSAVRLSLSLLFLFIIIIIQLLLTPDNGTHIHEITFPYFAYRSIRWTAHVQMCDFI